MEPSFIFSSNSVRLSGKDWLALTAILLSIFFFFPRFWPEAEKSGLSPGYRLPYEFMDDYWMFNRWSGAAAAKYPFLVLGDSVIWGHYVNMEDPLAEYLNKQAGENIFANLGVDGLHPVAMEGLIRYHGGGVRDSAVILHLNLLWMSSKKADLRGEEEFRFNHPRLVPQIFPDIKAHNPSFPKVVEVIAERSIPFFSWVNHLRIAYFENMSLQHWTVENPYKNPFRVMAQGVPLPENRPRGRPISWAERGVRKQDFPWVKVQESFQWASFKRVMEILKARNNQVFVLLGPLNSHLLTEESFQRYNTMKVEIEKWFEEKEIAYYSASVLPSELYADASHPLKEGYDLIAEELWERESFQRWMKSKGESKNER